MAYNIRDFGAVGDGRTLDTQALQQAIDRVAAEGGGEVIVPAGTFRSGTLRLAGDLTLTLEAGAVLLASGDIADYPVDPAVDTGWLRYYLLEGRNIRRFTLKGPGRIDGSGPAFWEKTYYSGKTDADLPPPEQRSPIDYEVYKPKNERPVVLYLFDCQDIAIEGVEIVNAPAYTVWTLGCRRVRITGITVRNPRSGPNTDILDIDSSSQVRISDCELEAGDDCIALKSDAHRLGRLQACEDVTVSNCTMSSATCAIRIGYEGDAPIRDCLFANLAIRDTRHGIDIISIAPVTQVVSIEHGTPIDRISFSNISMRNVAQAFFIWAGNEEPRDSYAGYIRGLNFSGIFADCVASSYIGSKDETAICDLNFNNVSLCVRDARPDLPDDPDPRQVPSHWGGGWKSGGLRLRRIYKINMTDCHFGVEDSPHPALSWSEVEEFTIDGEPQTPNGRLT